MSRPYDGPKIYAGQLRALGITGIPDSVPDCAWVPAGSIKGSMPKCDAALEADGSLTVKTEWQMTEPWRWVEAEFSVERDVSP